MYGSKKTMINLAKELREMVMEVFLILGQNYWVSLTWLFVTK